MYWITISMAGTPRLMDFGLARRDTGGRRYATAREMADDLRRFLRGEPVRARPIRGLERLWRWSRRKPALASLIGALATLLVAIAVGGTMVAIQFRHQAQDADQDLYYHRIALANSELTARIPHPGRAEELLAACPLIHRGWEWDYLRRLHRRPRRSSRVPELRPALQILKKHRNFPANVQVRCTSLLPNGGNYSILGV
jgi:hypothetical protein